MKTLERLPPLNGLKIFEAVARHQSMVAAAAELHLTHGAVSRQIKQLEKHLSVALFVRRNRGIFLTREGETLRAACVSVFVQITEVVAQIKPDQRVRPLVISCEPTIAMRWLIARLPKFQARYPEVLLHLFTAGGPVQFAEQGVDVAIRRNDFDLSGLCVEHLAYEKIGPVCAPVLWQRHLAVERMPRLHTTSRPRAWLGWLLSHGGWVEPSAGELSFEHFYLTLQAAGAGLGAAIASQYMAEQDVRDGRLMAPFGFVEDGSAYCAVSAQPFDEDPRKMLFLNWLREEFELCTAI